jgi:hypothetical protein
MKGCWRNVPSVALNAASYRLPLIVAYFECARQCRDDDDRTRTRGLWRANIEKITANANCKTNPLAGHRPAVLEIDVTRREQDSKRGPGNNFGAHPNRGRDEFSD